MSSEFVWKINELLSCFKPRGAEQETAKLDKNIINYEVNKQTLKENYEFHKYCLALLICNKKKKKNFGELKMEKNNLFVFY